MTYKFIISGPSQPQEAHKATKIGKFITVYDPKKTKDFKNYVRLCCGQQWGGRAPLEGPLEMRIVFNILKPKSTPKKVVFHVKKPDIKNLLASLEDGMKQIVFRDDNQICRTIIEKQYSCTANAVVYLTELTEWRSVIEAGCWIASKADIR